MDGKTPVVYAVGLVGQLIEHLRIHHGGDENKSVVGVGDNDKQCGFGVAQRTLLSTCSQMKS